VTLLVDAGADKDMQDKVVTLVILHIRNRWFVDGVQHPVMVLFSVVARRSCMQLC
jgi:hypothetical protein